MKSQNASWVSFCACLCGLALTAPLRTAVAAEQGQTSAPEVITWYLPLEKAADLLEQRYAVPVTYEDPLRVWLGGLDLLGHLLDGRAVYRPKPSTLTMPAGLTPEQTPVLSAPVVQQVVDAYHEQNPGQIRFAVLESEWGFHIVPAQVHDEQGVLVAASNLLDTHIVVPSAQRTASEHGAALCAAVTEATGIKLSFSNRRPFDWHYAANGYLVPMVPTEAQKAYMLFEWGAESTARDALVKLLGGSCTTMTWRVSCIPGPESKGRVCFLNVVPTLIGDEKLVVDHDRCTNYRPIPKN